jgi:hypothetical protein
LLKRPTFLVVVLALAASASTWFYMDWILKPQQVADALAHGRPRGNLSDLYPRWLGARELLQHRRNPYSPEITREIQEGYYGRPLDPTRLGDPKDEQSFAYPAYVVFLLGPFTTLPFDAVQIGFRWLLIALGAASVLLWLRVLRWRVSLIGTLTLVVLMLGWLPMVQGIKLQQLSLLVAGFLAACGACLAGGWLFCGGMLLAFATVKPQLAWPLVLFLLMWSAAQWRGRRRLLIGFALVMLLLVIGAEFLLPGWLSMFMGAIGQYHRYTQNQSVLVWMFGSIVGRIAEAVSVLACAVCAWRVRAKPANSPRFGLAVALVLALTVVIVPMFAPYNQVLLAPAILALIWREVRGDFVLPAVRLAAAVGALLVVWPWIATIALSIFYPWLTLELRQKLWPMPFYSNFMTPVVIFGLALLQTWEHQAWEHMPRNLREGAPQE